MTEEEHSCYGGVSCENWQKGIGTLVIYICKNEHITESMEVKGHERWRLNCSTCRCPAVSDVEKYGWALK